MVEEIGGGNHADPFLMTLIRHHSETPEDVDELVSFCRHQGFHIRHLEILLKRFGRRIPLMATRVSTTTWSGERMLRCTDLIMQAGGLRWHGGLLMSEGHPIPESVANAVRGRTLGEVIEHPYMPQGLVIDAFEQDGDRWTMRFKALTRKGARQEARSHFNKGEKT